MSCNVPNLSWERLNETLNENITTAICKKYVEIKAYEYKLQKFIDAQNTSNTTTIVSIIYLLQSVAESLQAIQVSCNA